MSNATAPGSAPTPPAPPKRGFAEMLSSHPFITSFLAIAGLWGALTGFAEPVESLYNKIFWRNAEESKIETLRAGQTVEYVKVTLGEPVSTYKTDHGSVFRWSGRGYNIYANVVDDSLTSFLVYVCDGGLHPSIGPVDDQIVANRTTFVEANRAPDEVRYNWAPAFTEYYEGRGEGRPGEFRHLLYGGVSGNLSGCSQDMDWVGAEDSPPLLICSFDDPTLLEGVRLCDGGPSMSEQLPFDSPAVASLREGAVINVIGEQSSSQGFAPSDELATIGK